MPSDDLLSSIKRLSATDVVVALGFFIAVISPGFMTVFHFLPHIAAQYDFLKLMILSVAIALPTFLINLLVLNVLNESTIHDEQLPYWSSASLISLFSFYPALYLAYYKALNFPTFVLIMISVNALFLLNEFINSLRKDKDAPGKNSKGSR